MNRKWLLCMVLLFFVIVSAGAMVSADETWKEAFDRICGQTADASSLSPGTLSGLVKESRELEEKIRKLDIPSRKVYLFRLEKCRKFFQYILDTKK